MRVKQFDGLRIFMVFIIIFSHFTFTGYPFENFWMSYIRNPVFAVDFFFILSGFGIMTSIMGKGSDMWGGWTLKNSYHTAKSRIRKTYFPYCISLLLCLPHVYYSRLITKGYSLIKTVTITTINLGFSLSLFQALIPVETISHGINPVGWFLSALFVCYIFCFPLFKFILDVTTTSKKTFVSFISFIFVTIFVFDVLSLIEKKIDIFNELNYSTPYIRIFFFILGALLARVRHYFRCPEKIIDTSQILVCLIVLGYSIFRNTLIEYCNLVFLRLLDVVICTMFCYFISFDGFVSKLFQKDNIVKLGHDSMYYYLGQFPAIYLVNYLFMDLKLTFINGLFRMIAYIIMCIISGCFLKILSLRFWKIKSIPNENFRT